MLTFRQLAGSDALGSLLGLVARVGGLEVLADPLKVQPEDPAPPDVAALVLLYRKLSSRGILSVEDWVSVLHVFRDPLREHGRAVLRKLTEEGPEIREKPRILAIADRRYVWLQDHPLRFDLRVWRPVATLPATREGVTYDITGLLVDGFAVYTRPDVPDASFDLDVTAP